MPSFFRFILLDVVCLDIYSGVRQPTLQVRLRVQGDSARLECGPDFVARLEPLAADGKGTGFCFLVFPQLVLSFWFQIARLAAGP